MSETDSDLLIRYARHQAEAAFTELVRRHIGLVYSAALRQVRAAQLAEEVAQSTFLKLARQAPQLDPGTILSAWLYQVTRREAIDVIRREASRRLREQISAEMNAIDINAPTDWAHIEPLLDEAMQDLDDADRSAVLLRYFENKSLRDVGVTLGISDDAAQKRVSRAVERLRDYFAKHGVPIGASSLAVAISANAIHAAPVGLALTISTAALAGATIVTTVTATKVALTSMINAKTISAILAATLVTGSGTYLVKQREADRLHTEIQRLVAQQEATANEREAALSAASSTREELERSQKDNAELLRLRGEVGVLRRQLESQKAQATQRPAATMATPPAAAAPGAYITKEQLAHVGFATPEAAMQTITWAMMKGTYDQVNEGASAQILASESKDPKARESFESRQKVMAPLFKGFQVVASKALADDKVELKIKMDSDPIPSQKRQMPPFLIQPMVKVGDNWKLGGSTREYKDTWDTGGQIQTFAQ